MSISVRRARSVAAFLIGAVVCAGLVSCAAESPTTAQSQAAARNRQAALSLLSNASLQTPNNVKTIGDRTDDLCGSLTSDRGGLDDTHIEGYECVAVRRILFIISGSKSTTQPLIDAGEALLALNDYPAGLSQQSNGRWNVNVPFDAVGGSALAGNQQLLASVVSTHSLAGFDVELPLYLANETTVSHQGKLGRGSLSIADAEDSADGILVTMRVRYYNSYSGPK